MTLPALVALLAAPAAAASPAPTGERIASISQRFLGAPYRLHPLGEGPQGEFDRRPLMDLAAFDCTTFVEETMALSLASSTVSAANLLNRIRYKDGVVSYRTRNHFPEADWIPNNEKAGFVADITAEVAGSRTRTARKIISKKSWYAAKTGSDIAGFDDEEPAARQARLKRLRDLGSGIPDKTISLPYVPIADIPRILASIPSGAIINLVRADSPRLPTLISHQGFLIREKGGVFLRHASSKGAVMDAPFLDYLARYRGAVPALLGVNVLSVKSAGY